MIATDISPRAIAFTTSTPCSTTLATSSVVSAAASSPSHGLDFDLIVCNPPFVISPDRATLYRDSGLGATVSRSGWCKKRRAHLRPAGTAHILMSWIHDADGDWSEPLRAWVADRRLRRVVHSPGQL